MCCFTRGPCYNSFAEKKEKKEKKEKRRHSDAGDDAVDEAPAEDDSSALRPASTKKARKEAAVADEE